MLCKFFAYRSEESAQRSCDYFNRKKAFGLHPFCCKVCGRWHILGPVNLDKELVKQSMNEEGLKITHNTVQWGQVSKCTVKVVELNYGEPFRFGADLYLKVSGCGENASTCLALRLHNNSVVQFEYNTQVSKMRVQQQPVLVDM